jgi:hypothetical protein
MQANRKLLLGLCAVFALALTVAADDKKSGDKEMMIKGTVACAKCTFKIDGVDKCQIALKAKDKNDKDVYYFFDEDSHKKYHPDYCKISKDGTVTGTVTEKDGKKWIKVTKFDTK